jgi:hypothetical protein
MPDQIETGEVFNLKGFGAYTGDGGVMAPMRQNSTGGGVKCEECLADQGDDMM